MAERLNEQTEEIQNLKEKLEKYGKQVTERSVYHDDEDLRRLAIKMVGYNRYLAFVIECTDIDTLKVEDKLYIEELLKSIKD